MGPTKEHYILFKLYAMDTNYFHVSVTAHFIPTHCRMPSTANVVLLQQAAEDLVKYLQNPHPGVSITLRKIHTLYLKQLSFIFRDVAPKLPIQQLAKSKGA